MHSSALVVGVCKQTEAAPVKRLVCKTVRPILASTPRWWEEEAQAQEGSERPVLSVKSFSGGKESILTERGRGGAFYWGYLGHAACGDGRRAERAAGGRAS